MKKRNLCLVEKISFFDPNNPINTLLTLMADDAPSNARTAARPQEGAGEQVSELESQLNKDRATLLSSFPSTHWGPLAESKASLKGSGEHESNDDDVPPAVLDFSADATQVERRGARALRAGLKSISKHVRRLNPRVPTDLLNGQWTELGHSNALYTYLWGSKAAASASLLPEINAQGPALHVGTSAQHLRRIQNRLHASACLSQCWTFLLKAFNELGLASTPVWSLDLVSKVAAGPLPPSLDETPAKTVEAVLKKLDAVVAFHPEHRGSVPVRALVCWIHGRAASTVSLLGPGPVASVDQAEEFGATESSWPIVGAALSSAKAALRLKLSERKPGAVVPSELLRVADQKDGSMLVPKTFLGQAIIRDLAVELIGEPAVVRNSDGSIAAVKSDQELTAMVKDLYKAVILGVPDRSTNSSTPSLASTTAVRGAPGTSHGVGGVGALRPASGAYGDETHQLLLPLPPPPPIPPVIRDTNSTSAPSRSRSFSSTHPRRSRSHRDPSSSSRHSRGESRTHRKRPSSRDDSAASRSKRRREG